MQQQANLKNQVLSGLDELGAGQAYQEELCRLIETGRLFQHFTHDETRQVARYLHAYQVPAEFTLYEEGGHSDFLAIVVEGKLNVYKEAAQQQVKKIATVRAGSILGEVSFIDELPHSASVVTATDSRIAILTRRNLDRITGDFPLLGNKLLKRVAWHLAARLRQTSGVLVEHLSW